MDTPAHSSQWSKWFNRGTVLGLFTGSLIAAIVALWLVTGLPPSDLTAGIGGGTWEQRTADFDSRLKHRFPVGIRGSEVTKTLREQGFASTWYAAPNGEFMASRDESSFACSIPAEVYWTVTGDDRLGSIRGDYHERGCL